LESYLNNLLIEYGLSDRWAEYVTWAILGVGVLILAFIANFIAKKVVVSVVNLFVKQTRTTWDDALIESKVLNRLANIAPILVIYSFKSMFDPIEQLIDRFSTILLMFLGLIVFYSFLNAVNAVYKSHEMSKQRPIKGYIQVAKIVAAIVLFITALATLLGQNPLVMLSGFGAMTAIILLMFKDSILGLVASIQLTSNDMVRIGDWIEMPKYGADGDVIDITLNTVKVRNWDKTITTIPSYSLVSDSFKNWRGMQESGGRRIKRAVNIDMTSVKFCSDEMLERFSGFDLIKDYLAERKNDVDQYNESNRVDQSELINGRRLTNVGTFRAYVVAYLRIHPKVHQSMTFLVRHLPPGENGLPIEIYVFSNDQEWANYESIQADIFDHILAAIPQFELRVFQYPTGSDLRSLSIKPPA